ncbi:MAG: flavin reductase family protein [Ignavibacteria bacterium]|nr:flavin reductase family protein [Ignavibacteria bacterium]
MRHIDPKEHPVAHVHQILLGGVAPRPIALVSTLDGEGNSNVSPFSFYNAFGANPPIVVVSPAFRGSDGTPKHTFLNILETSEFAVSAVTFDMVEQISLASSDYPRGTDEFVKAGFTKLPSVRIAPPGVAESPFVLECRLMQHVGTGDRPASGNLLIGEVVMIHVRESAFTDDTLDPRRLDLVARMGGTWYCRANGEALFQLPKPRHNGIGFDALPAHLLESAVLSGNDLGTLAGVATLPDVSAIREKWKTDLQRLGGGPALPDLFSVELRADNPRGALLLLFADIKGGISPPRRIAGRLQRCAQAFLRAGDIDRAWECALMSDEREIASLREG